MKNILKGLLKTATQIVKIGGVKNILGNENYIGTGYFGVKRGAIKVLDNLYSKRAEDVKELDYNKLIPTTISDEYEEIKEVNIKVNTTQIISESFLVYLNTSYYLFFNNHINDLKMYVKSPVDPIILANKNNEVLGIVLPLRLKHELVLIPNNNIIAKNNILVDLWNIEIINPKELDQNTREITRQLQFDYYKKGIHAKYSYTRLNKLGFKLSHVNFEEEQTLENYKKELEIKEQNKIKNNEYLQKLANEYIEYHNKSLLANQNNFNNIVDYTIEKINKVTYIVQAIDNNNNKIDYFRLNLLNCDVKLTEQKQIFKMIKEYLVNSTLELQTIEEDKINDLSVEEVETTKEEIKENNNNNMEVENMILYKSRFTGLKEVTEDQKNKINNNIKNGCTTMRGEELQKYIDSKFITIDTTNKESLYNAIELLRNEYQEESRKSVQNFDKLLNNQNLVNKICDIIKLLKINEEVNTNIIIENINNKISALNYSSDTKDVEVLKHALSIFDECMKELEQYFNIEDEEKRHTLRDFYNSYVAYQHSMLSDQIDTLENNIEMNLQLLATKQLRPIYNDNIEGHKEYQLQQLAIYNSDLLYFDKKRINNKMIEEYTKYFVYKDNTFMSVKPSTSGGYPSGYYENVRKYNYKVDHVNKVILFTDK